MRRLIGIMAPFAPHITEEIYRNLRCAHDPESVHMLDWQACDDALVKPRARTRDGARPLVSMTRCRTPGRRERGNCRWPVGEVVIVTAKPEVKDAVARLQCDLHGPGQCPEGDGRDGPLGADRLARGAGDEGARERVWQKLVYGQGPHRSSGRERYPGSSRCRADLHAGKRRREVRDRCRSRDLYRETPGRCLLGPDGGRDRVRGRGPHAQISKRKAMPARSSAGSRRCAGSSISRSRTLSRSMWR